MQQSMPCLSALLLVFIFSPFTLTLGAFLNKRHVSGQAKIVAVHETLQCTKCPHTYDSKHPSPAWVCPEPATFKAGPPFEPSVTGSELAGADTTMAEHAQRKVSMDPAIDHVRRDTAPSPTTDDHWVNAKRDVSSPTTTSTDNHYINSESDTSPPTPLPPNPNYVNAKRNTPSPPTSLLPNPNYVNAKRDASPPSSTSTDYHWVNAKRDVSFPTPRPLDPNYVNAKREPSSPSTPLPLDPNYVNAKRDASSSALTTTTTIDHQYVYARVGCGETGFGAG